MRLPLYTLPAQQVTQPVCFRLLAVVFLLFSYCKIVTIFLPARRIGQRRRATRAPMPLLYSTTGSDIPDPFAFCADSHKAVNALSADTFFHNLWDGNNFLPDDFQVELITFPVILNLHRFHVFLLR